MIQLKKPILICFSFLISAFFSIFLIVLCENNAVAQQQHQQFAMYNSERYGIQFEYPVEWTLKEKTSKFDDGGDITVRSPDLRTMFGFDILDASSLFETSDIEDVAEAMIPILESSFFRFDVLTIEEPHIVTIDNKTATTAIINAVEKYNNDNPLEIADQQWVVIIDNDAYLISFIDSPPDDFNSLSHTLIRDQFINSIKFLEDSSVGAVPQPIEISSSHFN